MPIRAATEADLSRIAEIFVYNNRINYLPIFQDEEYSFGELQVGAVMRDFGAWIGELADTYVYDDGILRGFASVHGEEITKLYVDPFFQGRGIGARLLDFAVEEKGANTLWVLEKNTRGAAFYARHGFLPDGEKKFEEGTAERLLRLRLGAQ